MTSPRAAGQSGAPSLPLEDEGRARFGRAVGILSAFLLALTFVFPNRADPLQSLIITMFTGVSALSIALRLVRLKQIGFVRSFGNPAILALAGFLLWSLLRWRQLEIPSFDGAPGSMVKLTAQGRPIVIAHLGLAVGALLGLCLAFSDPQERVVAWPAARKVMIAAAIGFACLGIYQYLWGYKAQLTDLRESGGDAFALPLMQQSVEHALEELRVGGRLGNPNVFAALLAVLAGVCLSEAGVGSQPKWRYAAVVGYLLTAATILFCTKSRGGTLTLLAATIGGGMLLIRNRSTPKTPAPPENSTPTAISQLTLLLVPLVFAAARVASAASLWDRLGKVSTIRERFNYWQIALGVWSINWLAGASPGGYMLYYARFKPPTAREARYAHSWFFHIGAELGVIGVVLFLIFVFCVAFFAVRSWRSAANPVNQHAQTLARETGWLSLAFGLLIFNGLFEYSLQMQEFLALVGFFGGGVIGLAARSRALEDHRVPDSPLGYGLSFIGGVSISVCVMAALWLTPPRQLAAHLEAQGELLASVGEREQAVAAFAQAGRWLPDDESLAFKAAMQLRDLPGKIQESHRLIIEAERMNPLSASLRAADSRFLIASGDGLAALKRMDEAVALNPHDAGLRIDRAEMNLSSGKKDAAIADLVFIKEKGLLIWEYQRPAYNKLCESLGLSP